MVRTEFNRIFDGTTYHKRKVMAGVVVDIAGSCSVISLSSGTKCINGESLSLDGLSLNDCHAEIIVRRETQVTVTIQVQVKKQISITQEEEELQS